MAHIINLPLAPDAKERLARMIPARRPGFMSRLLSMFTPHDPYFTPPARYTRLESRDYRAFSGR